MNWLGQIHGWNSFKCNIIINSLHRVQSIFGCFTKEREGEGEEKEEEEKEEE